MAVGSPYFQPDDAEDPLGLLVDVEEIKECRKCGKAIKKKKFDTCWDCRET